MSGVPLVELRNVSKSFGGSLAVDRVSFELTGGSVHALVGENGAGKSTVGKIIGGTILPTSGELAVDGKVVRFSAPHDALALGLAVIQQEPNLVPAMTVAENVFLGTGIRSKREVKSRYKEEVAKLAVSPPDGQALVRDISIADCQRVEILRALCRNARVIVMDEPTSSLDSESVTALLAVIRGLRDQGRTIVYVSHFLEEVLAIADRCTVLRDGRLVDSFDREEITIDTLVRGMLGRELRQGFEEKRPVGDDASIRLKLEGLATPSTQPLDLEVRAGEIVGFAGLVGSGRTQVLRAICGVDPAIAGKVFIDGRPLRLGSPDAAVKAGVGYIPEDRGRQGLLLGLSARENVTLPHLRQRERWGIPALRRERVDARDALQRVAVQPLEPERQVKAFSGGNQQKILFSRWLFGRSKVLLLDEPTRGVDVGAKVAIHEIIQQLAATGIAILLVSSEAEEIVGLAHRVLVMRRGRVEAELRGSDATVERTHAAALGLDSGQHEATTGM